MAPSEAKSVAIIMGSQSDWQTMKHAAETLDALQVGYQTRIVSAHRTPERLYAFARGAKAEGFKVIIAGAGGAAHLPGMTASLTSDFGEGRGRDAKSSQQGTMQARRIAERIAEKFGYVGVFAVETFVLREGELLVNEIPPRVHNSGHWTLDGASVSQFEQHIRAVAGWPLAKPVRRGRVEMTNLIGREVEDYRR